MTEEQFLEECAKLFGQDHSWITKPTRRTRWYPRNAGNGRFEGHGVVRWFSPTVIRVILVSPRLAQTFDSPEKALNAIKDALDNSAL